ncbi:MAG: Unknown protein [uncultured Thiotrichaceae bacterium]|uniref:Uncharacterized protein n=1 Tax=uncultured Thiotrichaceae bacterium TaxID=298394 RepID=A0A6S6TA29_9GAMM|nr:MAG: Unknown protein [uncultured Thiotrichaceae bacterium]
MTGLVFYYHGKSPNQAFDVLHSAIQLSERHSLTEYYDEFLVDAYVLADDKSSRTVAIDFDNTITADVDFYLNLIDAYRSDGWNPVVCTLRDRTESDIEEMKALLYDVPIDIYTSGGNPKQKYMLAQGICVNLWIDDFFPGICPEACQLLSNNGIDP